MKSRKTVIIAILGIAIIATVATAAAFAYRWMTGTATVAAATSAKGAACTGFYSSSAQPGITLPEAGTNYNAETYDDNNIQVTTGTVVCQWTHNSNTYYLYDSIGLSLPLTVGSWYIKDVYGFGYNGTSSDPTVYVTLKVKDAMSGTGVVSAELIVYKTDGTTVSQVGTLDLTSIASTLSVQLQPGEALQLDLSITTSQSGTYTFKVDFYASQSSESPR